MIMIKEILELPYHEKKKHFGVLASEFKKLTGRDVCLSCRGDIDYMLTYLKNTRNMSEFKFKNPRIMYKVEKGSADIISNDRMTDDKAIRFLKQNPSRISLFRSYPENWEEMVGIKKPKPQSTSKKSVETESTSKESSTTTKKSGGCSGCKDKSRTASKKSTSTRKKSSSK